MLGQRDAYREIRQKAFFGERNELIYGVERRTWTCALVPGTVADLTRILPMVRESMAGSNDGPMPGSLGGLLYRAGQVAEAIESLTVDSRRWDNREA